MTCKRPESVQIGPHNIQIEWVEEEVFEDEEVGVCMGLFDAPKLKIMVSEKLPVTLRKEVLLHECVHAVLRQMGAPYEDESFVQAFASSLLDMLWRNPTLTQYVSCPEQTAEKAGEMPEKEEGETKREKPEEPEQVEYQLVNLIESERPTSDTGPR